MSQTYHLDGMVVRDQDNHYVCEIIAYETNSLNSLLRAPEVLALVQVDRDIKAANLQLLVDKVLDYKEAVESAAGGPDHIDTYEAERLLDDTVALARSLKQ